MSFTNDTTVLLRVLSWSDTWELVVLPWDTAFYDVQICDQMTAVLKLGSRHSGLVGSENRRVHPANH